MSFTVSILPCFFQVFFRLRVANEWYRPTFMLDQFCPFLQLYVHFYGFHCLVFRERFGELMIECCYASFYHVLWPDHVVDFCGDFVRLEW